MTSLPHARAAASPTTAAHEAAADARHAPALAATHRRRRDLPRLRARAGVGALGAARSGAAKARRRDGTRAPSRRTRAASALPPAVAAILRGSGLPAKSFAFDVRVGRRHRRAGRWSPSTPSSRSSWPRRPRSSPRWRRSTCSGRATAGARARTRPVRSSAAGSPATWSSSAARSASPATSCAAGSGRCAPKGSRRSPATSSSTTSRCCTSATRSRRARPRQERAPDAPVDARTYNLGKLLVSVKPGSGERAVVTVKPRPANVVVVNDVLMGGGCSAWARWKTPDEIESGPPLQLWVRGRWSADCGGDDIAYVAPPAKLRLEPELGGAPALPIAAPRMVADLWAEAGGSLRGHVVERDVAAPQAARDTLVERAADAGRRGAARDEQDQQQRGGAQRAAVARSRRRRRAAPAASRSAR